MLPLTNNSTTMLLSTSNGISVIEIATIVRIQSLSNYSKLFFNNGKTLVVAKVLAWFVDKLPDDLFVRIHRSHLVNMEYVQGYSNSKSTAIMLPDKLAIVISRRKKGAVLKSFRSRYAA